LESHHSNTAIDHTPTTIGGNTHIHVQINTRYNIYFYRYVHAPTTNHIIGMAQLTIPTKIPPQGAKLGVRTCTIHCIASHISIVNLFTALGKELKSSLTT
jgi:hypothetical protein